MSEQYRVHWKNIGWSANIKKHEGHGLRAMPKEQARAWADFMNDKWDTYTHWIEPAPEEIEVQS